MISLPIADAQERGQAPGGSPGFTPPPGKSSPAEGLRFLRDPTAAAAISADELLEDRERKRVIGRGFADVRFLGKRIQADHIEIQTETRDAVATGNIVFHTGNDRIVGSRIDFNLDSERLVIHDARGYIAATYYITANVIRRISEDRYEVIGGTFTTCEGDRPEWAFHAEKSTFQIEGYAHLKTPLISLMGVPAAALPYAILPIKTKRATGFLMPGFGLGNKNGVQISPRFFWAINKWSDATLGIDHYTRRGTRLLGEYRYALSRNTTGQIRASTLKDRREDATLWDINALHISRFSGLNSEFKAVVDEASRTREDRSLEDNLDDRVRQETDTRVTYTKRLEKVPGQFQLAMRRREGLRENDGQLFQKFPEATLDIVQAPIGKSEFRFDLESSFVSFFRVEEENTTNLQRIDGAPTISLPLQLAPWLGVTPRFGFRYTYWTDQKRTSAVGSNPTRDEQKESALSREMWFSSVNVIGPRYSKIYDKEIGLFKGFKHILSFETKYSYTPAMDAKDRGRIIPIDEVDNFSDQNTIRYGIVNRVLTKLKTEDGLQSRQLFRANLFQTVDIDEARRNQNLDTKSRRPFGNLVLNVQSRPSSIFRLTHETQYNVYDGNIDQHSTGLLFDGGRNWYFSLDRTWVRQRNSLNAPLEGTSFLNLSGGYAFTPRWFIEYLTRLNKIENITLEQSLILRYRGCCWGFNLTFTDTQDTSEVFLTLILRGLLEGERAPTFKRRQQVRRGGRFLGGTSLTPYKFGEPAAAEGP
ncbi:LPS-assembly protein LptD [Nitrospinota bacterium]